ncbi:hypothetical protein [Nocardia sp. SYP-A9097]|uniref:hypothetical protein n=1 Tax=Nocardia sp. SYP-A9097 TaxID=2663237 RepID=UPI001E4C3EA9|nr:hypothetical protein [Nocardia sp. SYP-A9097]
MLGLPVLAVVEWPERADYRIDEWFGLHWKTRTLVEWAAGRPFIWIDDELGDGDQDWISEHHRGRALLHRVHPRIGLRHSDFATFRQWLATVLPLTQQNSTAGRGLGDPNSAGGDSSER